MQLFKQAVSGISDFLHSQSRDRLFKLYGYFHDTVTIPTKQGRITMSTRDQVIARLLFLTRQYEYDFSCRTLHFLKEMKLIPSSGVHMLDIGANIGIISIGLLLADQITSSIAIEPESRNYDLLKRNVKQNGLLEKIACLQMAVSDKKSTLTMELSSSNFGDHRIQSSPVENNDERFNESSRQTIQVQSLPLAQILKLPEIRESAASQPSMIWIDIQGYEGYVFKGAEMFLKKGLPVVSEIWPYGIMRTGMSLEDFTSIVTGIWTHYWIERRKRFIRYPITVFDRYLDELGTEGYGENVIFT